MGKKKVASNKKREKLHDFRIISKNVECHITACILSKVHNTTLLKFLKSSKRTKPIHELNTYKNP